MPQLGSNLSRAARFSLDDVPAAGAAAGLDADRMEFLVAAFAWQGTTIAFPARLDVVHPPHASLPMEQP